ncbi:unnamed protein product [Caenorhabditis nigoni]
MSSETEPSRRMCGAVILETYIPTKILQRAKLAAKFERKQRNEESSTCSNESVFLDIIRMYGSHRELSTNMKTFESFPLSHRCFGFDYKELYATNPDLYKAMNGVSFFNKAYTFNYLQHIVVDDLFERPNSILLFYSMQAILLKCHEERIVGVCEFIKYDEDWFPNLQSEFSSFHEKFSTQNSSTICEDWNSEKALDMFKSILPVGNEWESSEFEEDLKSYFDSQMGNFNEVNLAIESLASYLGNLILKNPETFLPYNYETNPNSPVVVRVFESHGAQFVMKSELFNAINIRNPNSKRLEFKDVDGKLMTMNYKKVRRKYRDRIGNIEFIKCPIQRAGHKAVPIMTPSGGHCILAMDFLFEMLNELIFGYGIFQKMDNNHWHRLNRFFLLITNFVSPHHKSIFFVTLEERDKQVEEYAAFWKDFDHVTNDVRNAGKDGFTVEDLEMELGWLGFTNMFYDIHNYAEEVYSEVLKAKKEDILRTCDLFKAIEKCVLNCIFVRFPTLHLFLHTQNACHLLPILECDFCISQVGNRFKNTNWKEPHYSKTVSTYIDSDPKNTHLYEISLPDGTKLTNSYNRFFNMEQIRKHNIKYFIYDQNDLLHFSKNFEKLKPRRLQEACLYNLDAFQKFYPEKKLYIRAIPSARHNREESKRVFTEEVLDLIPVVLRQQNSPISDDDERLAKYRMKWDTNNEAFETTISLTEFWYILEEFDVDKTRITICPDPVYELTVPKMVSDLRTLTLNVIGPHGEQMMRREQAVFHIFEMVVCSSNWLMDSCQKHENCLKESRDRVILYMRTYCRLDEGTYVTVEHVESTIKKLKNPCPFQNQGNSPSPLVELQKMKTNDATNVDKCISTCQQWGLSYFVAVIDCLDAFTSVFAIRKLYLVSYAQSFMDSETCDLFNLVMIEMEFRSSAEVGVLNFDNVAKFSPRGFFAVMSAREQARLLDKKSCVASAEKETPKKTSSEDLETSEKSSTVTRKKIVDPKIKEGSEVSNDRKEPIVQKTVDSKLENGSEVYKNKKKALIQKTPALEVKKLTSGDAQKTSESGKSPEIKTPSPEDIQKTSPIEKQPAVELNQSKNCSKCLRTSEMCNETKKELKLTQNRLEKYEKKAKRTEEVEIQMREMEVEMKKMKKERKEKELTMEKKEKENEDLKTNMLKLEAKHAKMTLAERNHSISQNELLEKNTNLSDQSKADKERIDELTKQLENQNEKIQLMELQIQQHEESLKFEIRQKERGFEELRAALTIMSNENESIQRENRNLREQIALTSEAPPTPTVPESPSEGPTHHRFALLGFQKIKDSLYHKKQLKQAKEMIEKLKSSSDLPEIHKIADYEYYQFEGKLLKYSKEVELNIQRIKETCDVSTVTPLPDSPEFSKRFVNLYWRIINNQSISPSEIEVSDSECFICTEEMTTDQKTLQCEECKKVTHFECASQWLKIHRSCPHCRREMLNPEEFPNLGQ